MLPGKGENNVERLTQYTSFYDTKLPVLKIEDKFKAIERLALIEDILGDEYDLDRLRKLVQIDQLIGKDVWSADPFQDNKPRDGGVVGYEVYSDAVNLFVNFDPVPMTAYFSLEDIGKTVFMTREEAEEARRREQE